jgi:DegV family protein with EDD domain
MSKVAVVTDSTAYIPKELIDQHHISIGPQILIWGQETFEDGVDIRPVEFYTRLQKATVMPSSSQVSIVKFKEIFSRLLDQGHEILAILISSKLSGTIDSAVHAKAMLPDAPIEIVDSFSTGMAMGFHVLAAARAAEAGASLAECKALAEKAREHTGILLTVDTLEFLHRGGRIGGASRFLGTALNIKPILELVDGRLEPLERVRTRGKAVARLVELLEERVGGRQPVRLAVIHANATVDAQALLTLANVKMKAIEALVTDVSPVIGTHVGPGTIAITYMAGM